MPELARMWRLELTIIYPDVFLLVSVLQGNKAGQIRRSRASPRAMSDTAGGLLLILINIQHEPAASREKLSIPACVYVENVSSFVHKNHDYEVRPYTNRPSRHPLAYGRYSWKSDMQPQAQLTGIVQAPVLSSAARWLPYEKKAEKMHQLFSSWI